MFRLDIKEFRSRIKLHILNSSCKKGKPLDDSERGNGSCGT